MTGNWSWCRKGTGKDNLKTGTREVTLLKTVAPLKVVGPRELGLRHGLELVKGRPKDLDSKKAFAIRLRPGISLHLQANDSHWLLDQDFYRSLTSWGPMSSARLEELGLLELVESNSRDLITSSGESYAAYKRLTELIGSTPSLAMMSLKLVSEWKLGEDNHDEAEWSFLPLGRSYTRCFFQFYCAGNRSRNSPTKPASQHFDQAPSQTRSRLQTQNRDATQLRDGETEPPRVSHD